MAASDLGPRRFRWGLWLGIPLLLALWANLHGSFVWGLLVLVCWFAGTAAETAWRAAHGSRCRRRSRGAALALAVRTGLAAACLNPYGVQLVLYNAWFADYRQLRDLSGWQPLVLLEPGGRELVASLLIAILVFRFSRRRLPVADVLLLAAFSFVFGVGLRNAWWYAAVFGVVAAPHLADVWNRWADAIWGRPQTGTGRQDRPWLRLPGGRTLSYTLMTLGLLWICFALSPVWTALVRGQPRPPERLYGDATPWKLTGYLRENPPKGQVYHPHWWGDWLIWDGPPGLRPFLGTNLYLAPHKVSIDYRIIRETRSGWADVLLRYGAETVVLDRRRQTTLHRFLRESDQWQRQYEDELSVVFARAEGKGASDKSNRETEEGVSIDE